ncbi:DUF1097 domain-containing protein [Marinobacter hydrocarbonoclasticus]|nr:DUF1097 domain-containing protein [Marinobacter nauticus]
MYNLLAIAFTTAVLSAVWSGLSVSIGLFTWAGFLGCTSYFASPDGTFRGLMVSLMTNLSGVFWALSILALSPMMPSPVFGHLITGLVAFMMCVQARLSWLAYIPGTFIGACATFASDGSWAVVVPSLMVGGGFGFMMKRSGLWLQARHAQRRSDE